MASVENVREQIAPLPGWVSLTDAAAALNISRQALHKRLGKGQIPMTDLARVGEVILVRESWVEGHD